MGAADSRRGGDVSGAVGRVGELALVRRIRELIEEARAGSAAELGPGDDAAVLEAQAGRLVLTVDGQLEGVHFERDWLAPDTLGRRAVAVALSDIAAMGADPAWLLAALALPPEVEIGWVEELVRGLAGAGADNGALLVGGDVTCRPGGVSIVVTAGGSLPQERRVLRRDQAREGDDCWVSGSPGLSRAGMDLLSAGAPAGDGSAARAVAAYRDPQPRLKLGAGLGREDFRCAAMDISDGLALDATRMCEESGVALHLDTDLLIDAELSAVAAGLGVDPLPLALGGGEDYELLFATPEREAARVEAVASAASTPVHRIGRFVAGAASVRLRDAEGRLSDPVRTGWDPFAGARA